MSRNHVMHEIINDFDNLDFMEISSKVSSQSFFVLDLDCPRATEFIFQVELLTEYIYIF